jgi:hypothetical protein
MCLLLPSSHFFRPFQLTERELYWILPTRLHLMIFYYSDDLTNLAKMIGLKITQNTHFSESNNEISPTRPYLLVIHIVNQCGTVECNYYDYELFLDTVVMLSTKVKQKYNQN